MPNHSFPPLPYADWQPTLTTLQRYAQLLGKIRRSLAPPQKHWGHVCLHVAVNGLTTSPIPAGSRSIELLLDLTSHRLVISTNRGEQWQKPLIGQSAAEFCEETLAALSLLDVHPDIDRTLFSETTPQLYDPAAVARYWQALSQIDGIFQQFKGDLRQETGRIALWPHHIDLAMLWFSGRQIAGLDPADEEAADEQMNFGFSPGDDGLPEPYFYITAYPLPDGLTDTPLPAPASWLSEGFTGAVLMYSSLLTAADPAANLLDFLRTVQQAGARLMQ